MSKLKAEAVGELKKTVPMSLRASVAAAGENTVKGSGSDALKTSPKASSESSPTVKQKANDRLDASYDFLKQAAAIGAGAGILYTGFARKNKKQIFIIALEGVTKCAGVAGHLIIDDGGKCPHCGSATTPKGLAE